MTKVERGGSECLVVVRVEVMDVLLRMSAIMLAKPMTMTTMMAMESSPPVMVLYCVSELYLSSWLEQNRSACWMSFFVFGRSIDYTSKGESR